MKSLVETLAAVFAGMVFVWLRHKEHKQSLRVAIAGASGVAGYAMASDIAAVTPWMGEKVAAFVVCVSAYAVLDTILALIADKDAMLDVIKLRMGKK